MSTSPTKGQRALPAPPLEANPSSRRRGHAHKRSGAVSSHDLSSILSPPKEARANSLPTTPSQLEDEKSFPPPLPTRSASRPGLDATAPNLRTPSTPEAPASAPPAVVPRPRVVGFADKLEYISRPLSTISSETSSSMSTIRPSHSVSGSVTSFVAEATSSPPLKDAPLPRSKCDDTFTKDPSSTSPTVQPEHKRKQSLENPVKGKSRDRNGNEHTSFEAAKSAHEPSLIIRRPSLTIPAQVSGERDAGLKGAPMPTTELLKERNAAPESSDCVTLSRDRPRTMSPVRRPNSSPVSKTSRSTKTHRSWIDPFRSRRTKSPAADENADAHENISTDDPISTLEAEIDNLDLADSICISNAPPPWTTAFSPRKSSPRRSPIPSPQSAPGDPAAVLDLDALLNGSGAQASSSESEKATTSLKGRMHSSTAVRGPSGPGGFHRRADSAPEMVPPMIRGPGLSRYGSNNAMADVFEEEEEDDRSQLTVNATRGPTVADGQGVERSSTETAVCLTGAAKEKTSLKRAGSCHARIPSNEDALLGEPPGFEPGSAISPCSDPFLSSTNTTPVDIVGSDEEPRTTTPSPDDAKPAQPTLPLDEATHYPSSTTYDINDTYPRRGSFRTINTEQVSSTVSSPDFTSTSFDVSRLDTARSSLTDRTTLNSTRNGNPSSYRGSVDDVPSLASATSSIISSKGRYPRWSAAPGQNMHPALPLGDHRNLSVPILSMPEPNDRPATASKRASLASLSKLMSSGSHGERSKLNIEHRPSSQDGKDGKEKKRGKRISKLMNFFKSKDRQRA